MSMIGKKWKIQNEEAELSVLEKLLKNRNIETREAAKLFLEPDLAHMHDPYLMKDMDKAVTRIEKALEDEERIIIFGDYDVDGMTSTAILFHTLTQLGGTVSYRLPHRVEDGYGLNEKFIDDFKEAGATLVITVDCGIACKSQIGRAADEGIDVIVTDHHTIPEEPPDRAVAILHPKQCDCEYPFDELTGAGVALKLAKALYMKLAEDQYEEKIGELLDLATMGTVADLGPLTGENRVIVRHGLKRLSKTKWPGIALLRERAGVSDREADVTSIGFHIAPRLNAAGRLSSAYHGLHLLLASSEQAPALVEKLETLNNERRQMTTDAVKEAVAMAQGQVKDRQAIVIAGKWHPGILGLIASRLVNLYNRPAFILSDAQDEDMLVGSVRCPEFFSVIDALNAHARYLKHFGGHAQAGGLAMYRKQFTDFQLHIWEHAERTLRDQDLAPSLLIDCELHTSELLPPLFDQIEKFAPFGMMNSEPVFLLKNVQCSDFDKMGKTGTHLRFFAETGSQRFRVVAFNMAEYIPILRNNSSGHDLVVNLRKNTWKGKTSHEFHLLDVR